MEKEPTLIEQKFEDAVKNFRKEMEKGKAEDSIVRRAYEEKNLFSHFYCSVCS